MKNCKFEMDFWISFVSVQYTPFDQLQQFYQILCACTRISNEFRKKELHQYSELNQTLKTKTNEKDF